MHETGNTNKQAKHSESSVEDKLGEKTRNPHLMMLELNINKSETVSQQNGSVSKEHQTKKVMEEANLTNHTNEWSSKE